MSTNNPKERPEAWLEEKVGDGAERVRSCRDGLEGATRDNPLAAVGIAFGVGYLARSLPLFRTFALGLRGGLHLLPYGLAALGAARAYELVQEKYGAPDGRAED